MSDAIPPTAAESEAATEIPTGSSPPTESEAATEIPTESRRGRPRVTPPYWDSMMNRAEPLLSRRSHVKRFYVNRAIDVLDMGGKFTHVTGDPETGAGPRLEVLTELGQIDDPDTMREAAEHVCEKRMKVKDAVAQIRQFRTGRSRPGNHLRLAEEIAKAIEGYVVGHPKMTRVQVLAALAIVRQAYGDDAGESDEADDEYPDDAGEPDEADDPAG